MNEPFILSVAYQGEEHGLKARFERWGYTHRFMVLIDEDLRLSQRKACIRRWQKVH